MSSDSLLPQNEIVAHPGPRGMTCCKQGTSTCSSHVVRCRLPGHVGGQHCSTELARATSTSRELGTSTRISAHQPAVLEARPGTRPTPCWRSACRPSRPRSPGHHRTARSAPERKNRMHGWRPGAASPRHVRSPPPLHRKAHAKYQHQQGVGWSDSLPVMMSCILNRLASQLPIALIDILPS